MIIGICEDNAAERNLLATMVRECFTHRDITAEIHVYENGEALMGDAKKYYFSILFMDIYLPGESGMDVALKLRKFGSKAAIVFTTSTTDFLAESYSVWAVHYLIKPISKEGVDEAATRASAVLQGTEAVLEIMVAYHREFIPLSDIQFIEAQGRTCVIHTRTGNYTTYTSITKLVSALADVRFVNCHRSYIINLDDIMTFQNGRVALQDGSMIPIRRGEVAFLRHAYEDRRFVLVSGRG